MFKEFFFTKLLDLEDGWIVESVDSDLIRGEVYIQVVCVLDQLEESGSGELCKVYDYAPERSRRHLDKMQYKTYIKCRLPRVKTSEGKIKTVDPNWASGYERHTFLSEAAAIDLLKASKNQNRRAVALWLQRRQPDPAPEYRPRHARKELSPACLQHLSIDEKSFRKGLSTSP